MNGKSLTKIEVVLPIKPGYSKQLSKIIKIFLTTPGVEGCTYIAPTVPTILKGKWKDADGRIIDDDVIWIHGCYDIEKATCGVKDLIGYVKEIIEKEGEQDLAWITYSRVFILEA